MIIQPAQVPTLPAAAEIALLRKGLAHAPEAAALRDRLADILAKIDAFAEVIALLSDEQVAQLDWQARLRLVSAYFARAAPDDAALAADHARILLQTASSDAQRAIAMAELARAKLRQHDGEAAMMLLEQAIALCPSDIRTFKRLTIEWLRRGEQERVLELTAALLPQGIAHARVLAARAMALAGNGQMAEAQAMIGLPDWLYAKTIAAPAGWPDLQAFNAALSREVMANPDLRFNRHGTASWQTWRVDDPAMGETPAVDALLARICGTAAQFAATLSGPREHPWLTTRPDRATMQSWCVITEGEGHERWHMHPDGWLSGGYYIDVPDSVAASDDPAGCLAFGPPDGIIGEAAASAFGETLVRPTPGLLTLFPSHAHHRTYPHGSSGRRICLAFDICPA